MVRTAEAEKQFGLGLINSDTSRQSWCPVSTQSLHETANSVPRIQQDASNSPP